MTEELALKAGSIAFQKVGSKIVEKLKTFLSGNPSQFEGLPLINMSGHQLLKPAIDELEEKYGIKRHQIYDINPGDAKLDKLVEHSQMLVEKIYEKIGENLPNGQYLIIPPGFSPLSLCLVSFLHGLAGHFPLIVVMGKEGKVYLPKNIVDLQIIRDESRKMRP